MTAAASSLGYVPSAVSQQITALERSLGVELFLRRPGSPLVVVTPAGRSVTSAAVQLFAATAAFQDVAQHVAAGDIAELRIGAYATGVSHLLPEALTAQQRSDVGPVFHLSELATLNGLPLVRSGEIDLLIAHRYLPEDPPTSSDDLIFTALGTERMLLVACSDRSEHPRLADCAQRDWVAGTLRDPDRRLLHRWSSELKTEPRVRYETADCHTALELIASDLAVGLIPATLVAAAVKSRRPVAIVKLPRGVAHPTRDILAVTRTRYRPPIVEDLIQRLIGFLARIEVGPMAQGT